MRARARFTAGSQRPSILQPRSEHAGFLLFNLDLTPELEWGRDAVLALQHIRQTEIEKTDITLSLNHANTKR
jgi:hypothetical protein